MEFFDNLALGFSVALTWTNLFYCFVGTVIGTLVGVLPGIGPVASIAMLLPATFLLPPVTGLIMLAGIYYGSQYGGSTTAILCNIPGEVSSVVTAQEGHQMALKGKAGQALLVAALGSFFAGSVGILILAGLSPLVSGLAFEFGPSEYFSLMLLGLIGAAVLARGSLVKAFAMVALGLLLGLVGSDVNSGSSRFTFGRQELMDGLSFVAVAMGLFGVAEIVSNLDQNKDESKPQTQKVGSVWRLSREEFRLAWPASLRGTALGSVLGILPGGGTVLASFSSYMMEKKLARDSGAFGHGAIQGVAGPESANNAGAQTSFVPMLSLGIPSNAVMALMLGALTIHNIQPGPQVMTTDAPLYWGLIASMWIGNAFLVVLNLPLIGIWVKLLTIRYSLLYPAILLFCAIGVYSVNNSTFEVAIMAGFGVLGYLLLKLGFEAAPMILGFVLGPLMEENLRRALTLSEGSLSIFVGKPHGIGMLVASAVLLIAVLLPGMSQKRDEAFVE